MVLLSASPIVSKAYKNTDSLSSSIEARAGIGDVPSVADIQTEIANHGRVGNDISLFYTSLSGQGAIQKIKSWYKCNAQPKFLKAGVAWDDILPSDYLKNVFSILQSPVLFDKAQKPTCQAFASQSAGTVFVFYPNGKGDPIDICRSLGQGLNPPGGFSAWCGQEFPALMRNLNVDRIFQVDPNTSGDPNNPSGTLIWTQADGVQLPIQDSQINL